MCWGRRVLLILETTVLLVGFCFGSSSHSLTYFSTGVSKPVQGLPQYFTGGYVDDQLFVHYDSNTRRTVPLVSWINKFVEEEDPQYWDTESQREQNNEQLFRGHLPRLQNIYNHSRGFHTWQNMYGCILIEHGHKTGFFQYGYDGRDLIHFDKETLTWVAANEEAQLTARKWNTELANNQYKKAFLEKNCIESLQKFLEYGTEALLRKVPPAVKVTHKAGYDGMETLVCQAHGFYPKEIEIDWMKDGEVWKQSTFHGQGPNPDGTYHTWLGIEIDPKDRDRYHCRVEHDSLGTPVDVAWEESVPVWIFVGCIVGALAVTFMFVTGITFYIRKRRGDGYRAAARRGRRAGYREAATSDQKSDSSTEA